MNDNEEEVNFFKWMDASTIPIPPLAPVVEWRLERTGGLNYQLVVFCDQPISIRGHLGPAPEALPAGQPFVIPIPSAGLNDLIQAVEQAPIEMAWNTKQPAKLASWLKGYGAGRSGAVATLRKHRAKVPE